MSMEMESLNGHQAQAAAPVRVRFGPRDDDDMPLSWAERLLTWLKDERPNVFADGMLAVLDVQKGRGR